MTTTTTTTNATSPVYVKPERFAASLLPTYDDAKANYCTTCNNPERDTNAWCPHDNGAIVRTILESMATACPIIETDPLAVSLFNYPIRSEYAEVCGAELLEVEALRASHWAKVGAYEGLTLRPSVILPEDAARVIADMPEGLASVLNVSIPREIKQLFTAAGESWRLSFRAGAIMGASMHDENIHRGSCACFGFDCEYEGTALNMALDPALAVLERVDASGARKDGFQFIVLTETGVHAYGGMYSGSRIDSKAASALAFHLAEYLRGKRQGCFYAELNNRAIDKLAPIMHRSENWAGCASDVYADNGAACEGEGVRAFMERRAYDVKCPAFHGLRGLAAWRPLNGVSSAYTETVYNGGFWATNAPAPERPYNEDAINAWLAELGIGGGICPCCGEVISNDYAVSGDDYGMGDAVYCSWACLEREMSDAADAELNGVYLISGALYSIND